VLGRPEIYQNIENNHFPIFKVKIKIKKFKIITMKLKSKITLASLLCAAIALVALAAPASNSAQAVEATFTAQTAATSSLSIDQLRAIVESLRKQIEQLIQLIAQLKPQETCGNGICRFGETATSCAADCRQNTKSCEKNYQCASHKCTNSVCCNANQCGNGGACFNKNATTTIDAVIKTCVNEGEWKNAEEQTCKNDYQCAGKKCINSVCCKANQCGNGGQCYDRNATATIDGTTKTCVNEGEWKNVSGKSCLHPYQCASGKCINSVCCKANQCGNGGACFDKNATTTIDAVIKTCVNEGEWKNINGKSCSNPYQCASGKCINQVCCNANQCGNGGKCYDRNATATIDGTTKTCVNEGEWKK
jgi:hypothetical protein